MVPPLLKAEGLVRRFRGVTALNGVDLEVAEGEVVGLIGPNGSGKSTLIDCLSGFQTPDEGDVEFVGTAVRGAKPHRLARLGMSRTFQNIRVYDELTVLDHLAIGNREHEGISIARSLIGGRRVREAEAQTLDRAWDLLDLVGLTPHADRPAGELSYGQSKLLSLASSLICRPRLLMLDEPLAGVNPKLSEEIASVIRRLNAEGQTFLIVEHNVPFIMSLSSRVVVLNAGEVMASGPPSLIREDERVYQAYLGVPDAVGDQS